MSPISRRMTTASTHPTPGSVRRSWSSGVGAKTARRRCSKPSIWAVTTSSCSRRRSVAYRLCGASAGRAVVRSHWRPRRPKRSLVPSRRRPVLGQGGVDPILEPGALPGEDHAGAGEIPLIPERAGRDPHRGERPGALEPVQPPRVELVGLVHHAEHELRLARVDQLRDLAGRFDLVHDPVPVADGLDRHRRTPLAGRSGTAAGRPGRGRSGPRTGAGRPPSPPRPGYTACGHRRRCTPWQRASSLRGPHPHSLPGSTAAYAAVLRRRSAFIASDSSWCTSLSPPPTVFRLSARSCPVWNRQLAREHRKV